MTEITRAEGLWVSVDLTKNVFQVQVESESGRLMSTKTLRRDRLLGWCQLHLPPDTTIAMEACAGAHHWARQLRLLGFAPMILAAHLVETFRRQGKRGKNDANDAATINEALPARAPRLSATGSCMPMLPTPPPRILGSALIEALHGTVGRCWPGPGPVSSRLEGGLEGGQTSYRPSFSHGRRRSRVRPPRLEHGVGVAHVARVAALAGQLEEPARQRQGHARVARGGPPA